MNKRELTARVQRHMGAGASRSAAQAAVNAVLGSILREAADKGNVHIAHLGTFAYQACRTRSGKALPRATDSLRAIRFTHRLRFRPARRLKQRIAHTPGN